MRDERSNPGRPTTGDRPTIRRRRRSEGRACRWDAQPALTTRDAAALRFVGEHYAVRADVLAVVLGRLSPAMPQAPGMLGVRTLRQRLGRWQQAGWVERRRLLAHTLSAQLARVVRELGGRPEVRVELLPQVPGLSYLAARGDAA
jgi:hypothetical protein